MNSILVILNLISSLFTATSDHVVIAMAYMQEIATQCQWDMQQGRIKSPVTRALYVKGLRCLSAILSDLATEIENIGVEEEEE